LSQTGSRDRRRACGPGRLLTHRRGAAEFQSTRVRVGGGSGKGMGPGPAVRRARGTLQPSQAEGFTHTRPGGPAPSGASGVDHDIEMPTAGATVVAGRFVLDRKKKNKKQKGEGPGCAGEAGGGERLGPCSHHSHAYSGGGLDAVGRGAGRGPGVCGFQGTHRSRLCVFEPTEDGFHTGLAARASCGNRELFRPGGAPRGLSRGAAPPRTARATGRDHSAGRAGRWSRGPPRYGPPQLQTTRPTGSLACRDRPRVAAGGWNWAAAPRPGTCTSTTSEPAAATFELVWTGRRAGGAGW